MTDRELSAWLHAHRALVDAALERFLPRPPACPPIVSEAMRYSLFAGGKRLRPLLTLAAAEAVAPLRSPQSSVLVSDLALPPACAIEMIHTYSLIHDDLPAMDDDTMRRGRPTAHVVYGEGVAILAGDALLTEAFGLMARKSSSDPGMAERALRTIMVIAEAAGAVGMVGGQAIDLLAMGQAADPRRVTAQDLHDPEALRAMHARKTGALIRASACAGAIMAGASPTLVNAVDTFASELGLAFQIVDDILDVEGASADLGKTAGKDAAAGKPTYPAFYGLDRSRQLARECIDRANATLSEAGISGHLPGIAEWVVGRRN